MLEDHPAVVAFRILVPRTPLIASTVLSHSTGWSKTSKVWDLRTALIINVLRSILDPQSGRALSILQQQRFSIKDREGIKGRMWIAKTSSGLKDQNEREGLKQSIKKAIRELGDGEFQMPDVVAVEAEWTGYRADVKRDAPRLDIPEAEQYQHLSKEATSKSVVLYLHGGAYYLLDVASHRAAVVKLAQLTKGRAYSVRYRLAPQNPFPAALIDALTAYLTLLYPPPGSFHEPVQARHIVFAGDSAGGGLSLALLQLILHFQRTSTTLQWHGQQVDVPTPAGLALNSPWVDLCRSLPSLETNTEYDYLPSPSRTTKTPPSDSVWPTDPPRGDLYAPSDKFMFHPLCSPITAKSWDGAPPIWMCLGDELLQDEIRAIAGIMASQGGTVQTLEFEGGCHCFAMVLQGSPLSKRCFQEWAAFIEKVTNGKPVESKALRISANAKKEEVRDLVEVGRFTQSEILVKMEEALESRKGTTQQTENQGYTAKL